MAVTLPTPGPNDEWGGTVNTAIQSLDTRVENTYTRAEVDQKIADAVAAALSDPVKIREALATVTINEGATAPAGISIVRPA